MPKPNREPMHVEELLQRYNQGERTFDGANLRGAELSGAYLPGIQLNDAILRDANLGGAHLNGALLRRAQFNGANMYGVDLRQADLSDADLRDAMMANVDLRQVTACSARLSKAQLGGCDLAGADLSDAELDSADLSDTNLRQTDLSRADLSRALLNRANLHRAALHHTQLVRADLSGTELVDANLDSAHLGSTRLSQANFTGANLTNADLTRAELAHANFHRARLHHTVFTQATGWEQLNLGQMDLSTAHGLVAEEFVGIDLTRTKLPREIAEFPLLGMAQRIARGIRRYSLGMLLGCLYCWLTIWSTSDISILADTVLSPLPLTGVQGPLSYFYLLAPILLVAGQMAQWAYYQKLNRLLAALPAVLPNGQTPKQYCAPRISPPHHRTNRWLTFFWEGWLIPATIAGMWFRYLYSRDWTGTAIHLIFICLAVILSISIKRSVLFPAGGKATIQSALHLDDRRITLSVAALFIALLLLSMGAIEGIPPDLKPYLKPRLHPPVTLAGPETSVVEQSRSRACRLSLPQHNLRNADLRNAPLVNADLRAVDLRGAAMQGADLSGADLRNADLRRADLRGSKLHRTTLDGTKLQEAHYNSETVFPANFDPKTAGMIAAKTVTTP